MKTDQALNINANKIIYYNEKYDAYDQVINIQE